MKNPIRLTAVALLALAAFAAFPMAPAQAASSYTAYGISSASEAAACGNASAGVESHCLLHGAITTTSLGCIRVYNGSGEYLGLLCRCTATTPFCYVPPSLPFP